MDPTTDKKVGLLQTALIAAKFFSSVVRITFNISGDFLSISFLKV